MSDTLRASVCVCLHRMDFSVSLKSHGRSAPPTLSCPPQHKGGRLFHTDRAHPHLHSVDFPGADSISGFNQLQTAFPVLQDKIRISQKKRLYFPLRCISARRNQNAPISVDAQVHSPDIFPLQFIRDCNPLQYNDLFHTFYHALSVGSPAGQRPYLLQIIVSLMRSPDELFPAQWQALHWSEPPGLLLWIPEWK